MAKKKRFRNPRASGHKPQQTSSKFLLLPGEIRTQIYRAALVKPDGIDLWPNTPITDFENHPELVKRLGSQDRNHCHVRDQHDLRYVRQQLATGLLGTCRQICMEATSIFWSENQFRFSTDFEWIGLRRFLMTIGAEARARITKLEVAPPHNLLLIKRISDNGIFYSGNYAKNHPKLRMAKLYNNMPNLRRSHAAYESAAISNVRFVSHIWHEERTLLELQMIVPSGWRIADARRILDQDLDMLRWLNMSLIVESGSRIDDECTRESLQVERIPVHILPGSCVVQQQPIQPRVFQLHVPKRYEDVAESVMWVPDTECFEDFIQDLGNLFDESLCVDAAKPAYRAERMDPRLCRRLKGFGGCRFVPRKGRYCLDCNQMIKWSPESRQFYLEHGSECMKCKGKSGCRYVDGIEVRKSAREHRRSSEEEIGTGS